MALMLIPSSTNMSSDRKRKASSSSLSRSVGASATNTKTPPRTDKLAKLLKVEELASSRRRRRRNNEDSQVLDLAAIKVWRQRVVQWFFDVVDHFDLPRDVVYVSAEILDCYTTACQQGSILSNSRYQEVSIASIFLATRMSKTNNASRNISMESFLMQTMGKTCKMTASQAMEVVREVSSALDWSYPILPPSIFVKQLLGMIPASSSSSPPTRRRRTTTTEALEHILYLTELAVIGDLAPPPSHASDIALAAMIQTMNPKTGPANCCLTQEDFQLLTDELKKQMNLDWCSNETIQTLCTQLGHAYAQSLVSHLSDESEPRPTAASSLGQAPVLIEEDNEEDEEETTFSYATAAENNNINNNEIEEYNNRSLDQDATTQSPAKRARII